MDATNEEKPLLPFTGPLAPLPIRPVQSSPKRFNCDICQKGINSKNGLTYHMQVHLNGRPFECDKCGRSFGTKIVLDTHYKRHLKHFTCDFCSKGFSAKHYLLLHISAYHLPKYIPCVACCQPPRLFATNIILVQHYQSRNKSEKSKCKLCGHVFTNKRLYVQHYEKRKLLKYECPTCGEKFPCIKLYKQHAKKENSSGFCKICNVRVSHLRKHNYHTHRGYKCKICDKQITGREAILKHKKECGSESQVRALGIQCKVCESFFSTKVQLDAHLNSQHPNFSCSKGSKSFYQRISLRSHERRHTKNSNAPYKCVLCPTHKNFWSKETFDSHFYGTHCRMKLKNRTKQIYFCDACKSRSFQCKETLVRHMNFVHLKYLKPKWKRLGF